MWHTFVTVVLFVFVMSFTLIITFDLCSVIRRAMSGRMGMKYFLEAFFVETTLLLLSWLLLYVWC